MTTDAAHIRGLCGLLFVLLAVSCAGSPEPPPSSLPPESKLHYHVEVRPGYAVVELRVDAAPEDTLELRLDALSDARFLYDPLLFRASKSGLRLEEVEPGHLKVTGTEGASFVVRYLVLSQVPKMSPSTLQEVYSGADRFAAWGSSLFAVPGDLSPWSSVQVKVEAGRWPVWTSWGRDSAQILRHDELLGSLFLAGDWKVDRVEVGGSLLQVARFGAWKASDSRWRNAGRSIFSPQTSTLGRYPRESFLMAVVPSEGDVEVVSREGGALGTASPEIDPVRDREIVEPLLSVGVNLWFSSAIKPEMSEVYGFSGEHLRWLTRGVRSYYEARLLLRSRAWDVGRFVKAVNQKIRTHYKSREQVNERVRVEVRGWLLGLLLDVELRNRSQNLKSLDHLLRKLAYDRPEGDLDLSNGEVREALEALAGDSFEDFFRDYVEGEKLLPLANLDRGGLLVQGLPHPVYELGFETEGDGPVGLVVAGVVEGSEAEIAGVKKGDLIKAIEATEGKMQDPVRLSLERAGEVRRVEFYPVRNLEMPVVVEHTDLFLDWFGP